MRALPALAWHVSQLLCFQHNGQGLPCRGSILLAACTVLKLTLTCLVISQLLPDVELVTGAAKSLLAVIVLYAGASLSRQFYAYAGYLFLWLSVDVGLLGLNLIVDQVPQAFIVTCYAWSFLAFIALLVRAAFHNEKQQRS